MSVGLLHGAGNGITTPAARYKKESPMTWDQLVAFFSWMPKHHTFYTDYWNGVRDEPKEDTGNPSLVLDGDVKRSEFEEWRKTQSQTWTTAKPTKEGFYWLRNVETVEGYTHQEPEIVEVFNLGNGYPGNFDVSIPSDECTTELRHIIRGEWYGPIEAPK